MDKVCISYCGWGLFKNAAKPFDVSKLMCQSAATIFSFALTFDYTCQCSMLKYLIDGAELCSVSCWIFPADGTA